MRKKISKEKPKAKKQEREQPPEKEAVRDDAFDFGGLPDRNLKKSLGCG